jgi:hypothetical protein
MMNDTQHVVENWEVPTTVKDVQSFLELCDSHRESITDYSLKTEPLVNLTKQGVPFDWTTTCEEAFQYLREALLAIPGFLQDGPGQPTMTDTDSDVRLDPLSRPIGFTPTLPQKILIFIFLGCGLAYLYLEYIIPMFSVLPPDDQYTLYPKSDAKKFYNVLNISHLSDETEIERAYYSRLAALKNTDLAGNFTAILIREQIN